MSDWLLLILAALATYRIAWMLAREEGPFAVFETWRSWLARRDERAGKESWVTRGFSCVLCLSFWLAFAAAAILPVADWREYVLSALGVAGAVVILHKLEG